MAPPPPPPCAPPPPPTFYPPPPPPNTMIGRKRNRIDCRKLSWETLSPDLLKQETIWKRVRKFEKNPRLSSSSEHAFQSFVSNAFRLRNAIGWR